MTPARALGQERGRGAGPGRLYDFTRHQVEHALRQRARYRYVQPRVLREDDGLRIESPCCSRNVDSEGGVIDIARLTQNAAGVWCLHARDHVAARWTPRLESGNLTDLLDALCVDADRVFWP